MWMDDLDEGSISSEESAAATMCTKHLSLMRQRPWDSDEVRMSLSELPAGETALSVIAGLEGESLDKALADVQELNLSGFTLVDRKLSIPCFANGYNNILHIFLLLSLLLLLFLMDK